VVSQRVETPFPVVGQIAIVGGVRHSILGGKLVEISSREEEEVVSSSSYRSVPLAPVHNVIEESSRPPSCIE
jgi:hypothetical protein